MPRDHNSGHPDPVNRVRLWADGAKNKITQSHGYRASGHVKGASLPAAEESGPFVPDDFSPPTKLDHPEFRLRPLGPEHNGRNHAAWMSSVGHIQATAGFGQEWFSEPISPEENLADLQRHQRDFRDKIGFTYTVLDARGPADRAEVIGCVYLYPNDQAGADVEVLSWVRADRAELDALVATTVRAWLRERWPWAAERILDYPRHGDT